MLFMSLVFFNIVVEKKEERKLKILFNVQNCDIFACWGSIELKNKVFLITYFIMILVFKKISCIHYYFYGFCLVQIIELINI